MKFEKNPKYTSIAIYAFIVIAAAILFNELLRNVGGVVSRLSDLVGYVLPVIYGAVIAFLLNPIMRMFEERLLPKIDRGKIKLGTRRKIAIVLTYLVAGIAISLFFAIVLPQVIVSINGLIEMIQSMLEQMAMSDFDLTAYVTGSSFLQSITQMFDEETQIMLEASVQEAVESALTEILNILQGFMQNISDNLWEKITGLLVFAADMANRAWVFVLAIVNVLLGLIISIYFLADREKLFAQLNKIVLAVFPKRISNLLYDIARESNRILSGFIIGKIIDSIIIGILCFIGMIFICPQYAVLIALIIGVTNIIPYFGPFIGAIPCFFLVLISETGGFGRSIWFLVFILALQQFDGNILGPKILGDTTGLSALWVIFSIMLFSGMFGVLGMFIGVPAFAVIYYMIKRFTAFLLRKKGVSTNTRDYASLRNPLIK